MAFGSPGSISTASTTGRKNRETGRSEGATQWDPPAISAEPDGAATIRLSLRYAPEPGQAVLAEERVLRVSAPDWLGRLSHRLDVDL